MLLGRHSRSWLTGVIAAMCPEIEPIQRRTREAPLMGEGELWRELVSCILGSRVPYHQALSATQHLTSLGLLELAEHGGAGARYEKNLRRALAGTMPSAVPGAKPLRYRFPNLRADHIRRTAACIYEDGSSLVAVLESSSSDHEARARIVNLAVGIGPKQASLFLRNIGYSDDLAVLDVHVLRYMAVIGLRGKPARPPASLIDYERAECLFRAHSREMGYPVGCVDIAVWIVMRLLPEALPSWAW